MVGFIGYLVGALLVGLVTLFASSERSDDMGVDRMRSSLSIAGAIILIGAAAGLAGLAAQWAVNGVAAAPAAEEELADTSGPTY